MIFRKIDIEFYIQDFAYDCLNKIPPIRRKTYTCKLYVQYEEKKFPRSGLDEATEY